MPVSNILKAFTLFNFVRVFTRETKDNEQNYSVKGFDYILMPKCTLEVDLASVGITSESMIHFFVHHFIRNYLKLEAIMSPMLERHSSIRGIPTIA